MTVLTPDSELTITGYSPKEDGCRGPNNGRRREGCAELSPALCSRELMHSGTYHPTSTIASPLPTKRRAREARYLETFTANSIVWITVAQVWNEVRLAAGQVSILSYTMRLPRGPQLTADGRERVDVFRGEGSG